MPSLYTTERRTVTLRITEVVPQTWHMLPSLYYWIGNKRLSAFFFFFLIKHPGLCSNVQAQQPDRGQKLVTHTISSISRGWIREHVASRAVLIGMHTAHQKLSLLLVVSTVTMKFAYRRHTHPPVNSLLLFSKRNVFWKRKAPLTSEKTDMSSIIWWQYSFHYAFALWGGGWRCWGKIGGGLVWKKV